MVRQPNMRLTIRSRGEKFHFHHLSGAPICELEKLRDWLDRLIAWRKQELAKDIQSAN